MVFNLSCAALSQICASIRELDIAHLAGSANRDPSKAKGAVAAFVRRFMRILPITPRR